MVRPRAHPAALRRRRQPLRAGHPVAGPDYHRPCLFATERAVANGRIHRVYRAADVQTPYEKLRSLPHAEACLNPGVSFAQLDAQAHAHSDLQAARVLNTERDPLFRTIAEAQPEVA